MSRSGEGRFFLDKAAIVGERLPPRGSSEDEPNSHLAISILRCEVSGRVVRTGRDSRHFVMIRW